MDALPLAYTPHPAAKPKTTPMAVAGGAQRERGGGGLAILAGAAMTVMGTVALSSVIATPVTERPLAPISVENVPARASFETRTTRAVLPAAEPSPVELRPSSPLPIAGEEIATNSAAAAMNAPQALQKTQQFHSLTSFDNTMEMTSGSAQGQAQPQQMVADNHYVAPPPVVWNRPLHWIQTNDLGGGYSGSRIR